MDKKHKKRALSKVKWTPSIDLETYLNNIGCDDSNFVTPEQYLEAAAAVEPEDHVIENHSLDDDDDDDGAKSNSTSRSIEIADMLAQTKGILPSGNLHFSSVNRIASEEMLTDDPLPVFLDKKYFKFKKTNGSKDNDNIIASISENPSPADLAKIFPSVFGEDDIESGASTETSGTQTSKEKFRYELSPLNDIRAIRIDDKSDIQAIQIDDEVGDEENKGKHNKKIRPRNRNEQDKSNKYYTPKELYLKKRHDVDIIVEKL